MRHTFFQKVIILTTIFVLHVFSIHAQDTIIVNGVILSNNNRPIPNVSISIEGTSLLPVVTNEAGKFSLKTTSGEGWIIISPTSDYKKKRVFLNNKDNITIYLAAEDISAGDDQFSILSQQIRNRNIISAYSELVTKDFYKTTAITIDQYMQGRIPGMYVVNRSGMPASGAVTTIRGVSSIYATNQPLYIVDGIPLTSYGLFGSNIDGYAYNPLTGINPFDISRTTVIKDPAITAAYGSQASNGLIIIETLDPSVTETTIDLDLRFGYSLAQSNLIPQLNGGQHKTLMNEILFSTGKNEEIIRGYYPCLFLTPDSDRYIDYQHNTNWQELIFKNSTLTNLNLVVKGGDEIARYGLSFGYMNSKGIIKETGYSGYNLRFVGRLNIFTWLKMNAGVSLNTNSANLKEAATSEETSPILASLAKSPLLNPYQYDEEGRLLITLAEVDELGTSNPLAIIYNMEAKNKNYSFISTLDFETRIKEDLTINSKFNFTYNILKEQIFMPNHGMEHYFNQEAINVSQSANNSFTSIYNNTYLNYNKSFGNNHQISTSTGLNVLTNNFEFDWGMTKNAHENDQYRTLQDGQDNLREIGGQNRLWNWMSLYEYFTYKFKDKYLLTATISLDGSSRVGGNAINTIKIGNVPFGLFYSGGVAWRLSSESFLKNQAWLEDLKVRITAGKTGNDDIGESSANNYYQVIKYRETAGLYPAVIPNDKLSYETVSQINTGIDMSLWGDRFRISFDLFRSLTNNMVIYTPITAYFGYDYKIENGGKLVNRGLEFYTFFRLVDRNSFKWDLQANISSIKNEIVDIKLKKLVTSIPGGEIVNMEGSPANSFYGYIFKGVYSTQEEATNSNLVNDRNIPYQAGDAIYEDISGPAGAPDRVINEYDKTVIGSSFPDYFGGFFNSFSYKRWTLNAFVQFVGGNDIFNYVRYKNEQMTGLENQSQNVLDRWQFDGQETDVPRASWNDPVGNSDFSTRWIENGSYLRVKNISLSYKISNPFLAFKNVEFYISASNIITLNKYLGYDPEFGFSHLQIHQGIDYGLAPQPRQFIAGIRVGL
jgi:TonB-linked SusC/RagA family outer membrane protein